MLADQGRIAPAQARSSGNVTAHKVGRLANLPRDATRFSGGHTEGLGRVRGCFVIRLAERPRLLCKRIQLRLHELSLNSKDLFKILGLAQLAYAFGVGGDILLAV